MTALDREDCSVYTPRRRRGGGWKAVIEVRLRGKKKKKGGEGTGSGRRGNKRTKLNTARRDWKVFLQRERHRGG